MLKELRKSWGIAKECPGVMGCPQATRLGLEDPHGLGKSFSGWG